MKLTFKFTGGSTPADRERVLEALREQGVRGVRALFPDSADEEPASLFIVDDVAPTEAPRLLDLLTSFAAVEFAEEEVRRKLVW